uniref:Uncharacterized protein n=1 Tax=Anopheles melas TaxID=34690 RepID=A0A182TEA8_9DIPT
MTLSYETNGMYGANASTIAPIMWRRSCVSSCSDGTNTYRITTWQIISTTSSRNRHMLYSSCTPSMKPITAQKWMNASRSSRLSYRMPSRCGRTSGKPMKPNVVSAISGWLMKPRLRFLALFEALRCMRRTCESTGR